MWIAVTSSDPESTTLLFIATHTLIKPHDTHSTAPTSEALELQIASLFETVLIFPARRTLRWRVLVETKRKLGETANLRKGMHAFEDLCGGECHQDDIGH
jgi:hypothetical protein